MLENLTDRIKVYGDSAKLSAQSYTENATFRRKLDDLNRQLNQKYLEFGKAAYDVQVPIPEDVEPYVRAITETLNQIAAVNAEMAQYQQNVDAQRNALNERKEIINERERVQAEPWQAQNAARQAEAAEREAQRKRDLEAARMREQQRTAGGMYNGPQNYGNYTRMSGWFCTNCGSHAEDGDMFCMTCGAKKPEPVPQSQNPTEEAAVQNAAPQTEQAENVKPDETSPEQNL